MGPVKPAAAEPGPKRCRCPTNATRSATGALQSARLRQARRARGVGQGCAALARPFCHAWPLPCASPSTCKPVPAATEGAGAGRIVALPKGNTNSETSTVELESTAGCSTRTGTRRDRPRGSPREGAAGGQTVGGEPHSPTPGAASGGLRGGGTSSSPTPGSKAAGWRKARVEVGQKPLIVREGFSVRSDEAGQLQPGQVRPPISQPNRTNQPPRT